MKAFHTKQVPIIVFRVYDFVQNVLAKRILSFSCPVLFMWRDVLLAYKTILYSRLIFKWTPMSYKNMSDKRALFSNPRKILYSSAFFAHLHK